MIKYTGVNHLAMATMDMDSTIRFWRDLLGMRMLAGLGKPGYRHYFFEISENDMIAFFEWPDVKPVEEKEHGRVVSGPFVFDHVSLGVATEDILWEIKDRISAAGFWVSEVIDHGFIHSLYSFDTNGIPIEFSCNVPGTDIHRTPIIADLAPSSISQEGPGPHYDKWPPVENTTPPGDRRIYPGQGRELFTDKKNPGQEDQGS